ncbi:fimbrial chaperone protein FimC [Salmonella enterica subsp. enterica serovar Heidelberg str. RI-11-013193]|nr:fimbrial chaperone protein FimC [Salmonella enterica subsp. enterica serovar Heidelberg str. RI-11-013193]
MLSRIKLFVRPANLPQTPEDAPTLLKFSRVGNHLKITNPSAYYLTLVNISVGAKKIDNVMIAPKSDMQIPLPTGAQGNVTFQSVNDYGALTSATTASLG